MGEFDLIARLADVLGRPSTGVRVGIGDDAALLDDGIAVSCDLVVEDVHFRRSTSSPADIGWKALAAAVSDLAAMGAAPVGAVIGLAVGPGWSEDDLVRLYGGVRSCALEFGCPVVGGDVVRAPALCIAVTVLGRVGAPLLRSGARPGDVVAVTGTLGGSEAGRLVLEGAVPAPPEHDALARRHRRPRPLLDAGELLAACASAMLDVSDGVASDARRLAEASGVTVVIDLDALPLDAGVAAVARSAGQEPGAFAAAGGEDYELLVTIDPARVAAAGVPLTVIGRVEAGAAGVGFVGAGAAAGLAGWDHLQP